MAETVGGDAGERGGLVCIADAASYFEATMIQGLLETNGVRSFVQPSLVGLANTPFGKLSRGGERGAQRVFVAAAEAGRARSLIAAAQSEDEEVE